MPRLSSESSVGWSAGSATDISCAAQWAQPGAAYLAPRLPWAMAALCDRSMATAWPTATPDDVAAGAPWSAAQSLDCAALHSRWVVAVGSDRAAHLGAEGGSVLIPLSRMWIIPWGISSAADSRQRIAGSGGLAAHLLTSDLSAPWRHQAAADAMAWLPWGIGLHVDGGVVVVVPAPDPDPGAGPSSIPVLEFYLVTNTVALHRVDTGEYIEARDLQVSIDRDGPHWSWSASIPGSARGLVVRGSDLLATFNGTDIRLVVERTARDRKHGSDWTRASGRSRSAWLSAPTAAVAIRQSSESRTAQQLAIEALAENGISLGWSLDWQIPDWLIPGGVWSHQGTPLEAVARIAEAGGGYLQADPSAPTLIALPHYPIAPWGWAAAVPDIVIPEDVVEVEGTASSDRPTYNAVYVAGQGSSGRMDRILRSGSAGNLMAPQIVDALATHPDMTRARGLAVLADTGAQALITLRLPVLQETGLIVPGKLIEYVAEGISRRGLSRSLSVDFSFPELWQTIEVDTHG